MIHGSRASPARNSISVMRLAASAASGFGKVLGSFGARTADERRHLALAVALEEAREGARAGQPAHQRAVAGALAAPRRHEGAHVGGRQFGELLE